MVCAAVSAQAKTVAYTFGGGSSGVEIEQSGPGAGGLTSGFTFDSGCTNQQQLILISTKGVKGVAWSYTGTDAQMPGFVLAYVFNETALTWDLYAESSEYGIPLELLNSGTLTKTKPCQADSASVRGKSYLQRLAEARLLTLEAR
jgi:hypothetical protein